MIRSHFLPAAYIGRFSTAIRGRTRERRVWVLRRGASAPVPERAGNLARIRGFYEASLGANLNLEDNWGQYEHRLPAALDALAKGDPISARTWLHVLVPFVTGILVRGPDFDQRHAERLGPIRDLAPAGNDNGARALELQRLLAVVLASDWSVFASPSRELVSNDLGRSVVLLGGARLALAIPLDSLNVLVLTPTRQRSVLRWSGSEWLAYIGYGSIETEHADELNRSLAVTAKFCFGSSRDVVGSLQGLLDQSLIAPFEPAAITGFTSRLLVAHEFDWYFLVAASMRSPTETTPAEYGRRQAIIEATSIAKEQGMWCPPVLWLGVNLPEFPSGVSVVGDSLVLTLHEIGGFTVPPYWEGFGVPEPAEDAEPGPSRNRRGAT